MRSVYAPALSRVAVTTKWPPPIALARSVFVFILVQRPDLRVWHFTTVRQRSLAATRAIPALGEASVTSTFTTQRPRVEQLRRATASVGCEVSTTRDGGVVMTGAAPVTSGLTPKP